MPTESDHTAADRRGQPTPAALAERSLRTDTLVSLADSLVDGFDAVDLADRVVRDLLELTGVAEAAIVLDDLRGNIRVLASSSEDGRLAALLEDPGVVAAHLEERLRAWGVTASYAVPMRFRDRAVGAVHLYCRGTVLSETQLQDARLLASLATVALLTHRSLDKREAVVQRLQSVLNDRITIEQAKGVLAERESLTPSAALQSLRAEAERDRVTLSAVAHRVVVDQERRARPGSI